MQSHPMQTIKSNQAGERTQQNFQIMCRAVRDEHQDPLSRCAGPDWQAAAQDYMQRGGEDMEPGEMQQLFREACEELNLDY